MTYPSGPYEQGLPGQQPGYEPTTPPPQYPDSGQQPGFPQPPGYPQPFAYPYPEAGYPGGQQAHGFPPRSPSGAAGITAGVLAVLGSLVNLAGGVFTATAIVAVANDESARVTNEGKWAGLIVFSVLINVAAALLVAGAVTLFMRRMIGRWLVAGGCVAVFAASALGLWVFSGIESEYDDSTKGTHFLGLFFPIVTLVLVLLPTTGRWIRANRQSVPPPYYPPPYPG